MISFQMARHGLGAGLSFHLTHWITRDTIDLPAFAPLILLCIYRFRTGVSCYCATRWLGHKARLQALGLWQSQQPHKEHTSRLLPAESSLDQRASSVWIKQRVSDYLSQLSKRISAIGLVWTMSATMKPTRSTFRIGLPNWVTSAHLTLPFRVFSVCMTIVLFLLPLVSCFPSRFHPRESILARIAKGAPCLSWSADGVSTYLSSKTCFNPCQLTPPTDLLHNSAGACVGGWSYH